MSAGQRRDFDVVSECGAVRSGAWEGVLLCALLVGVDEGEDLVEVGARQLADALHEVHVVDRVHGYVVAWVNHPRDNQFLLSITDRRWSDRVTTGCQPDGSTISTYCGSFVDEFGPKAEKWHKGQEA